MPKKIKSHIIVIDTQQYAGNFERDMCAYITGQIGDCGVGQGIVHEHAASIKHLSWWSDNIVQIPDDRWVCRPTSIYPTLGWFNNGMGSNYEDKPQNYDKAIAQNVKDTQKYYQSQIHMAQKRLDNLDFENPSKLGAWTKEACERTIANAQQSIANAAQLKKYPAYLSVAIYVKQLPPHEVLEELKQRAHEFAHDKSSITGKRFKESIFITNFRIIEAKLKHKMKKI